MGYIFTVNRKERKAFMDNLVSRCYDPKDSFSWRDFKECEVNLIPIDFSPFPKITKETKEYIERMFDDEDRDRNGNFMLRFFTGSDAFYFGVQIGSSLKMEMKYPSSYSYYGYNDDELMLYTWCEGDAALTLFPDLESYRKEKRETIKWYAENY